MKKTVFISKIKKGDEWASTDEHWKIINDIVDMHLELGQDKPVVNLKKLWEYIAWEWKILVQKHLINRVELKSKDENKLKCLDLMKSVKIEEFTDRKETYNQMLFRKMVVYKPKQIFKPTAERSARQQ